MEALNVSWNGLLALVLNVEDWNAWMRWMEVVGVVFYSPQPLPSRWAILPSADGPRARSGRSAPVDQRLKMQRSAVTAISTAILHLMRRQMSDRPSRGRSGRAPRTVREAPYNSFFRTRYLRVFRFLTDRTVRAWGRTVRARARTVFAFPSDSP